MGLIDKVLSHIRMLANGVIAARNEKNSWAVTVDVRRTKEGARITVRMRPGSDKPSDILLELSDVADAIRNELRLERTPLGSAVFGTSESTLNPKEILRFPLMCGSFSGYFSGRFRW